MTTRRRCRADGSCQKGTETMAENSIAGNVLPGSVSRWRALFPPAQWLPAYQVQWLPRDLIAGVTLAAYAVPVAMAYASLAGLPPQHGIYCYLLGGVFYALFGTSRQLAIGPTSAISLLVGVTVAGMTGGDPVRWTSIAALTALLVACMSVLAWALRLSTLINFIGETILVGFKAGAALSIAMTQLPKLFGVPGGEHFFARIWMFAGQLGDTHLVVLGCGLAALALLVLGERWLPGRPVPLLLVALALVVMSVSSLGELGVTVVGALPQGLPALSWPSLRPSDVDGILPLAGACFLLAYIEGVSAARTLASKHGYEIDPRQELLALGAANLAAAFGQGFPVTGGLSQSAVNDKAGARTPLALVFASATLALCLLLLTGLLRNLPNVVLAAIVLVAVRGLIDLRALRHLWRVSRFEFKIAMVALVGVLLLGILKGVLLAAVVSILMLIGRVSRPHVAFLGRIPGTQRFSDLARHPDNEVVPGVVIVRVEASLVYFNAGYVRDVVRHQVHAEATPVQLVVWDLSSSPYVDVVGARMLADVEEIWARQGIQLRLADARADVRDTIRAEGLEARVSRIDRRTSVEDIVTTFRPVS
jgi:sulfate permease, SulP family